MDVINITITASSKLYPDFSPNILYKNQFNLFLKSSFFTVVKFMWVFYCIKIKHVRAYFVNLHNKCWLVYWPVYMYMHSCSQVIIIESNCVLLVQCWTPSPVTQRRGESCVTGEGPELDHCVLRVLTPDSSRAKWWPVMSQQLQLNDAWWSQRYSTKSYIMGGSAPRSITPYPFVLIIIVHMLNLYQFDIKGTPLCKFELNKCTRSNTFLTGLCF